MNTHLITRRHHVIIHRWRRTHRFWNQFWIQGQNRIDFNLKSRGLMNWNADFTWCLIKSEFKMDPLQNSRIHRRQYWNKIYDYWFVNDLNNSATSNLFRFSLINQICSGFGKMWLSNSVYAETFPVNLMTCTDFSRKSKTKIENIGISDTCCF